MVNPAFVFLPLYLYPYNASSWVAITTAVAAFPTLKFQVVIAPNLSNIYPDLNYQRAISGLNNHTNVQTLGYVPTSWGNRDKAAVEADVSCYAAWSNFTAANIAVQGIFFDEAPSLMSNDTLSYMSTISSYARTALGPGRGHITFNPGVVVDPAFYSIADTVVIFENSWSEFNPAPLNTLSGAILQKSTYRINWNTPPGRMIPPIALYPRVKNRVRASLRLIPPGGISRTVCTNSAYRLPTTLQGIISGSKAWKIDPHRFIHPQVPNLERALHGLYPQGGVFQLMRYVVHNFTGSGEVQADLINNITDLNIGGLLITTSDGYTDISSLWSEFCEELANKNNGGDLPDGDVYPVQSETKRHISSETTSRANLASC